MRKPGSFRMWLITTTELAVYIVHNPPTGLGEYVQRVTAADLCHAG
jgi:hypothetical protein